MIKLFLFLTLVLTPAAFAQRAVICTCYIDYGLSFENCGSIILRTNIDPNSSQFSEYADRACYEKYKKNGVRAIECSQGY